MIRWIWTFMLLVLTVHTARGQGGWYDSVPVSESQTIRQGNATWDESHQWWKLELEEDEQGADGEYTAYIFAHVSNMRKGGKYHFKYKLRGEVPGSFDAGKLRIVTDENMSKGDLYSYFSVQSYPRPNQWMEVSFTATDESFWMMLGAVKKSASTSTTVYIDSISLHELAVSQNAYSNNRYRYGFNGQERDEDNLVEYIERNYDPIRGQWISPDGAFRNYPSHTPYGFTLQNPIGHYEIDGDVVETGWDVFNVVTGAASLGTNISSGNVLGAIVDVGGLILDGAATVIPGVPGGAATLIKSTRLGRIVFKGASYSNKVGTALKNSNGLRTALKIVDDMHEAHHIIPKSLLQKNKVVQDAVDAGFDFNGVKNGIAIKKYTKAGEAGQHANHPAYTKQVLKKITDWADEAKKIGTYSPAEAKKYIEGLAGGLKNKIQKESVEGGAKVNELIIK